MRISPIVRNVLDAATIDGDRVVLNGQLERKLYTDTAKALEAAGAKWNKKARAHLFTTPDAAERIEQIILTGEIVHEKQELQQFFTPADLAAKVAARCDIRPGMKVLEPNVGGGALAQAAKACGGVVTGYEVDPKLCAANEAIHADFTKVEPTPVFDRVLMNPPFAKGADVEHVSHALKFLAPGGRLVAIMSGGVTFRQHAKMTKFRAEINALGGTIEALPSGSFKTSGTLVETILLVVDKPKMAA